MGRVVISHYSLSWAFYLLLKLDLQHRKGGTQVPPDSVRLHVLT